MALVRHSDRQDDTSGTFRTSCVAVSWGLEERTDAHGSRACRHGDTRTRVTRLLPRRHTHMDHAPVTTETHGTEAVSVCSALLREPGLKTDSDFSRGRELAPTVSQSLVPRPSIDIIQVMFQCSCPPFGGRHLKYSSNSLEGVPEMLRPCWPFCLHTVVQLKPSGLGSGLETVEVSYVCELSTARKLDQDRTRAGPRQDESWTKTGPERDQDRTRAGPRQDQSGPRQDQSWTETGPELDRDRTRAGPRQDQSWTETGPELDRDRTRAGPRQDQSWIETGPELDRDRTRAGLETGPELDQDRTRAGLETV
ncbi:hypothetical protein WMY93_008771 [Mugilogobius chulae]|uniref:Uncharacterized protein n=1 Tax=Mugilogobius chulae TaxID=88201 RepID=A0AAW0PN47_9GOBI